MIHKEKLDSLCHINSGGTPPRGVAEYYGGKIPWAKIRDIEKSNGTIYSTEEYITEAGLESIGNRIFPKDTLLFAMYGSVGKVAFCGIELSTNQAILGIRLKPEAKKNLDLEYLKYWFQVNLLFFKSRAVGGILKNLSATIVRDFDIPLPSLTDQKRIAKILSQCEALIQKRKESIDLLDELLKSTFLEMFGDESKFKSKSIEEIASDEQYSLSSGPFGSNLTSEHYTKDGVVILRGKNISSGRLDLSDIKYVSEDKAYELRRSAIKPNDIVIVAVGSSGTALRIPEKLPYAIMSQNFNKITPNQELVLPIYLEFSINSQIVQRQFRRVMTDGGRTFLGLTKIKETKIPVPEKEEQIKFEQIALKIEAVKNKFNESLEELENLYGSISQRAFKGELDLSKVDISNMEDSKKKGIEGVKEDLTEEQFEELINSFEHTLPTGEVPSNRSKDIRGISIREYLGFSKEVQEENEGIEFSQMNKDFFYQFILKDGFADGTFTLPQLERYARKYILRGTGFEFAYENWRTIIFRFIGAKQPILEQVFDEEIKTIKLKLTDEAFKV